MIWASLLAVWYVVRPAYIFSREGSSLNWKVFVSCTSMSLSSWADEPLANIFDIWWMVLNLKGAKFEESFPASIEWRWKVAVNLAPQWRNSPKRLCKPQTRPSSLASCKQDHHPLGTILQSPSLFSRRSRFWVVETFRSQDGYWKNSL